MGLYYSILSYFYPGSSSISQEQIQLSAQQLSQGLKLKMAKLQKSNSQLQREFIQMISQPNRDLFMEKLKIDNLIIGSIKYGVYEELFYCSQRIKQEAGLISSDLSKVSDDCLVSIYSVVHLYKDLQLNEFIDLKEFIPQPYPVIGVDKLQANIRKFLEFKKPTQYERNIYVLEMVKRHEGKVSILQLNQMNHGFVEKPPLPVNEVQINSANLYARSASYQIINEEYGQFAA